MGSYVLTWQPILGGHLALGHKPGKRMRKQLAVAGCSLVNLLSASESKAKVRPDRIRLPMTSARPPSTDRDGEFQSVFARIQQHLDAGGRVYVHCSAGLHRTGMVAYAFLRSQGRSGAEAVAQIRALRALTADELTEERRVWGDRFARITG